VAGRLTVCPTPIGNLEDLSPRARRALAEADLVACEDTRRAGRLYERLEVPRPRFVSNHEGNEAERAVQLAQQIERGAKVALVSDAGTPAISDPGYRLIRACLERDLEVEVLPGPSAVITALVASGLPTHRWRFEGYLPRRAGELERVLHSAETVVAFESPRRLPASLAALAALAPNREAAVCRELTKLHEEVVRGDAATLAARYAEAPPKGEVVLVIGAAPPRSGADPEAVAAVRKLVEAGARARPAASVVADLTGASANDLYRAVTEGAQPRND
jgi:16S rRNA (cytidine1402-2'-O)-methyltransferase